MRTGSGAAAEKTIVGILLIGLQKIFYENRAHKPYQEFGGIGYATGAQAK